MDNRVSLITLGVADIARARAFYEALGWKGQSPDGEVVFFQAGGMVLALWGRDMLARDSVVEDAGGWGGVTLAYCVGSPAEVDSVLAAAAEAGATIGRPGAATFWGGYSGIFIDPDGHPWEVAHNPGWTWPRTAACTSRAGVTAHGDAQPTASAGEASSEVMWRERSRSHCRLLEGSATGGSHATAQLRPERLAT